MALKILMKDNAFGKTAGRWIDKDVPSLCLEQTFNGQHKLTCVYSISIGLLYP